MLIRRSGKSAAALQKLLPGQVTAICDKRAGWGRNGWRCNELQTDQNINSCSSDDVAVAFLRSHQAPALGPAGRNGFNQVNAAAGELATAAAEHTNPPERSSRTLRDQCPIQRTVIEASLSCRSGMIWTAHGRIPWFANRKVVFRDDDLRVAGGQRPYSENISGGRWNSLELHSYLMSLSRSRLRLLTP